LLAVKGRSAATALLNRAVSAPPMPAPQDQGQREPVMDARPTLDMTVTDAATPQQTIAAAELPERQPLMQPKLERSPLMQPKKVVRMPMPAVVPIGPPSGLRRRAKRFRAPGCAAPFPHEAGGVQMNWSAQG
jgi:hypothetical protein